MSPSETMNEHESRTRTNRLELLTFRLNDAPDKREGALYGINMFKVRELMVLPPLTVLPQRHPCMIGIANVRGSAVSVIDLNRYCGFECSPDSSRILILTEFNRGTQGFLVDEVEQFVQLNWNDVHAMSSITGGDENILTAASVLADGRMVMIIDVERMLAEVLGVRGDIDSEGDTTLTIDDPRTVYFADDSAVARAQIARILDHMGLAHRSAKNGEEAFEELARMADASAAEGAMLKDRLLAIITDIEMPKMDGHVLTTRIKSDPRFAGVPVIMHSSLSSEACTRAGLAAGADAYLHKLSAKDFSITLSQVIQDVQIGADSHSLAA